jgi:WD40 repeat protein
VESGRERTRFLGHIDEVKVVALSADGRRLLSGGDDHIVRLWDVETGRVLRRFSGQAAEVNGVAVLPGGRPRCVHRMDPFHRRGVMQP